MYRPCAGSVVFNRFGKILIGKRLDLHLKGITSVPFLPCYLFFGILSLTNKQTNKKQKWQFPQGGIEEGEQGHEAALRETFEEVNISPSDLSFIGSLGEPQTYDFHATSSWRREFRGQRIQFFLFFSAKESETIELPQRDPGSPLLLSLTFSVAETHTKMCQTGKNLPR